MTSGMETTYTFTVKDNEVIFTKDEEKANTAKEELIETLIKFMGLDYDDAVFYATYLNNLTYKEVLKQDTEDRKQEQPGFWDNPDSYKELEGGLKEYAGHGITNDNKSGSTSL